MKAFLKCFLVFGLWAALPLVGHAYITSATLEYSVDDEVGFYLNGKLLLKRSDVHWDNYAVLSTSDGTLPLELFNLNGDNVLAAEDFDTGGYYMDLCYRLTVHHSNGDPVVVWSEPNKTKFLHFSAQQADPQGWYLPNYDDSAWPTAKPAYHEDDYVTYPYLPDQAFKGLLGMVGHVPLISHRSDATCNARDHNLFRSHFSFPYTAAKATTLMNPKQADYGQQVAFRLIPGADSADIGAFQMVAELPVGLNLVQKSPGGMYNSARRELVWSYPSAASQVRFLTLTAASVLSADNWESPQKVLGAPKYKPGMHQNIPDTLYYDGAGFYPNSPAWFRLAEVPAGMSQNFPVILGVIFHSQLRMGGTDTRRYKEVDPVYFNYAVDNQNTKCLKEDVWVSRSSTNNLWLDGYYDATEDRKWTWNDIANLRVFYRSEQRRNPDKNKMASAWVVVKCFNPNNTAPSFVASVEERQCKTLVVKAGLLSSRFASAGSDPLRLPVNQRWCPSPTLVPTPVPPAPGQLQATPTPQPKLDLISLGCLQSSPEPFKRGGVFIYFCIKSEAEVTLNIYDGTGTLVRSVDGGQFRPGNNQLFYNGTDNHGRPLPAGAYTYELKAKAESGTAERRSTCHKLEDEEIH